MNETLRANKQSIREFLRTPVWSEEKLCQLLAHAQDKLSMWSCCCLIGVPTADHALRGSCRTASGILDQSKFGFHYPAFNKSEMEASAEDAFARLGGGASPRSATLDPADADELRRTRIRPLIRAELRRRASLRSIEAAQAPASAQEMAEVTR